MPRKIEYQFYDGFDMYQTTSFIVASQPIEFLTGGDFLSATYPEIRFGVITTGSLLAAATKFKIVPPAPHVTYMGAGQTTFT